jgi:hypothetical protein
LFQKVKLKVFLMRLKLYFLMFCWASCFTLHAQIKIAPDSVSPQITNDTLFIHPRRPVTAAATIFGINVGVWGLIDLSAIATTRVLA